MVNLSEEGMEWDAVAKNEREERTTKQLADDCIVWYSVSEEDMRIEMQIEMCRQQDEGETDVRAVSFSHHLSVPRDLNNAEQSKKYEVCTYIQVTQSKWLRAVKRYDGLHKRMSITKERAHPQLTRDQTRSDTKDPETKKEMKQWDR